jgi:hypothetical protein
MGLCVSLLRTAHTLQGNGPGVQVQRLRRKDGIATGGKRGVVRPCELRWQVKPLVQTSQKLKTSADRACLAIRDVTCSWSLAKEHESLGGLWNASNRMLGRTVLLPFALSFPVRINEVCLRERTVMPYSVLILCTVIGCKLMHEGSLPTYKHFRCMSAIISSRDSGCNVGEARWYVSQGKGHE